MTYQTSSGNDTNSIYNVFTLSTAEVEATIFQGDLSPDLSKLYEEESESEYVLIGDEIMRIRKSDIPIPNNNQSI